MHSLTDEATSKFANVEINSVIYRIHYNDTSNEENRGTVVLLHGSGPGASGWSNFNKNIKDLYLNGYRVILMDCLGWGRSDSIVNTGSRSELNADTLKKLIDILNINKIDLIGNSMGGHSAVAFALKYNYNLNKLILMGGGTGGQNCFTTSPAEGIKIVGKVYRNPTQDNIKELLETFVYDSKKLDAELISNRTSNILENRNHLNNFVLSLEANPRQFPDVTHRLGEIKNKTLILWGRDDRFVPLEVGLRLVSGIENSELHIVNKCGHWIQWEYSEKFNKLVIDFLENNY